MSEAPRTIEELESVEDPAWPLVRSWIDNATNTVELLPTTPARGRETLLKLQVTARAALGALALHSGGLLLDHRWLRIMGGSDAPVMNLASANALNAPPIQAPSQLLVAFDVLGGQFAINGGALAGSLGEVHYFAPDELAWLPMGMGHGDFVAWAMTDALGMYYEHLRWPGWEGECEHVAVDEGLALYPFPFTREGQDLAKVSRRIVPLSELIAFYSEFGDNPQLA